MPHGLDTFSVLSMWGKRYSCGMSKNENAARITHTLTVTPVVMFGTRTGEFDAKCSCDWNSAESYGYSFESENEAREFGITRHSIFNS